MLALQSHTRILPDNLEQYMGLSVNAFEKVPQDPSWLMTSRLPTQHESFSNLLSKILGCEGTLWI